MERPAGPPLGAATQSSGWATDGPATTRQPPLNSDTMMWKIPTLQRMPSDGSMFASNPTSTAQVVALAREAMQNALEENQTKSGATAGITNELKPGITIDMSHKNIQRFPEEVVDIIKSELERLALSHNQISTFPSRFAECTSLRYLNVRNNAIREFPLSICELSSLEILDISRNKLRILPPELAKLTALKVLSVQKNRIEDLPLCLADMNSLQCLKLDGNPIRYPPKEVLQAQASSPPNGIALKESEINDVTVTSQIKKFFKQKLIMDRSETESGGEESSEGAETPRPKRVTSGRFPIKVNGSDVPDSRSPALQRPPPIPSRSHYRGLSQQNAALRRPGIMPLTIGNSNERVRSNSESLLQRDRAERADRSRRMGVISKKPSDLTTVEELKSNRYSHLRGLSHGSAIQSGNGSNGTNGNTRSPASPADSTNGRSTYVRRLSSLPERKRKSNSPDPVIEGAKGILFALDQVHPLIQSLMGLTRDGSNKRTSLERVFFNATTHVEELDHDIQEYDTYSEEDEEVSPRSNANVRRACITCVSAYIHVCTLLSRNVESLLNNGDPRYIRMLLLHIYGSLVEVRNAGTSLIGSKQKATEQLPSLLEDTNINTIRPSVRDKTPTRERPNPASRMRSASTIHQTNNLRVLTDSRSAYTNGSGRSATMTSATPRSGESFTSVSSAGRMNGDFTEEDRLFDRIFLGLQQSSEMAIRTLPTVNAHFVQSNKNSMQQGTYDQLKHYWQALSIKCSFALETAETLKARLSLIKLKEPGIRTQGAFWELCNTFMSTYYNLVVKVKEVKSVTSLISTDVIALLRPLQKVIRETSQLIQASPWSFLTGPSSGPGGQHHASHANHHSTSTSSSYALQSPQVAMPMTPASAALGPAVQATVPSAPQSAGYGTGMFQGNVFERADALLSMGGSSAFSSRAGTMTAWGGSGDGQTPGGPGTFSPTNGMVRYGGGKVVF
ncbi:hypothetical protein VE02_03804 [Pseudogymnoascus sp. 03VT05]|nr:hypothetical protein VE02_03804 [Pseudogymnoascus sp. 03VT05]